MLSFFLPYDTLDTIGDLQRGVGNVEGRAYMRILRNSYLLEEFMAGVGRGQWLCRRAHEMNFDPRRFKVNYSGILVGGDVPYHATKVVCTQIKVYTDGLRVTRGLCGWSSSPYGRVQFHLLTHAEEIRLAFSNVMGRSFVAGSNLVWHRSAGS